eukprot:scaffold19845_cov34-Attheya_sp.AAC.2
MAPNQTALSATTMSPLTTDATSHSGVVGINLGACARGPRAAESNEFQGWCGDALRQAYKNRFLSFEFFDATSHNHNPHSPQSRAHQLCVYTAFTSKRRRISSHLSHDTLISPNPFGVEQLPPSTAHAYRSAHRHPTTIPAVIRIYVPVPGFVIDAPSTLPLAAVGGDRTTGTTGSTIYHTLVENSLNLNRATSMPNHIPQHMLLHPTVATSPSRPYPSIVAGNPARFYTYQPQPMGSNMSALAWHQSQLGHATTPPPLIVDLDDYNSDSSTATDEMPSLSYPM